MEEMITDQQERQQKNFIISPEFDGSTTQE
jgi:hypothetical protein